MSTYSKQVNDVKTLDQAMELLGESSTCEITCCFEGNIMYMDVHGNDNDGNGLNIAIAGSVPAEAVITEGQPKPEPIDKLDQASKLIADHIKGIMDDLDACDDSEAFADILRQLDVTIHEKVLALG